MANRPANANRPRALPSDLLRFYAVSAAIVLALAIIIAGYANRRLILKIASVNASVPPKAAQSGALGPRSHDVWVSAPWALSALPECVRQTYEASGSVVFVAGHLPHGFTQLSPGASLHYADCTIAVRAQDIFIRRGKDRFYVPPRSQLFGRGTALALMHEQGGRAVLRIYEPAPANF